MKCSDLRAARARSHLRQAGRTEEQIEKISIAELLRFEARVRRARRGGLTVTPGPRVSTAKARDEYGHPPEGPPSGMTQLVADTARWRRARQTHPGKRGNILG